MDLVAQRPRTSFPTVIRRALAAFLLLLAGLLAVQPAAAAADPVANAGGPYTGLAGQPVQFSGARSADPAGETLTFAWNFHDGSTATGPFPTHTFATAGTYDVTLVVTDTDGRTGKSKTKATISATAPPVANAGGPYNVATGRPLTFDGSASSDPQGETLTYAWLFADGSSGTGVAPTHTYTTSGERRVTLTITNTDGATGSATALVTVTSAAKTPTANAGGPYSATAGVAITFDGSGSSDPRGSPLTYAWTFGDGGSDTVVNPVHTYTKAGTYNVGLTVTDSGGFSSSSSTTATITKVVIPTANPGGPYNPAINQALTFNGSASSDPQGEALTYAWNFGDGSTGAGVTPTHTYTASGNYTVTLTVTDTDGNTASATVTVGVPVATKSPSANASGPYSGVTGTAVTFNGSGSTDPRGSPLTYAWTFGDGASGTGVSPTHVYAAAATYNVQLTVTNGAGFTNAASTTATITAPPQGLTASPGGPYNGSLNQAVNFSGSGSYDPKSEALTYAWDFGDGSTGTGVAPAHTYTTSNLFTVTLTVTNTDGKSASASTTVSIPKAGKTPVANAGGPYSGVVNAAVSFSGAASADPRGIALTYSWQFGDGGYATGVTPTHIYAAAGTYTVTLTVANAAGQTNYSLTTASIAATAPAAPTANPGGPYTGTANTAVQFTGSASTDPKSETLTYAWIFGDGTSGTGVSPTHIYSAAGKYTVSLTVTNTDGVTASASTIATISAAVSKNPTASTGGPYTGTANTAVQFSGASSTDPQNESMTYAWTFGDGSTGTGATPTHTYTAAGTFTVSLTVTNTDNLTGSASTTATIAAAVSKNPTASAGGPYTGTANTAVQFSGSSSTDPQNEPLTYAWTFGDGSTGTGATPTHTYKAAGTFMVGLTVTDTDGNTGTATTTATISAAPSTTPIPVPGGPYSAVVNTALAFNGSASSDPRSETLTYAWAFGDGGTATGATPTHTYTAAGTYTAFLSVTDTDGLSATASTTVSITAAASQNPIASPGGPYAGFAGVAFTFDGTHSSDPSNPGGGPFALTFMWNFGDGTSGVGANPTHIYASAGTYAVSVTVRNSAGLQASATTSAVIATVDTTTVPTANPGGPYTGNANQAVSFTGSGTDPLGGTLVYTWNFGDGTVGDAPASTTHTYLAAGTYAVTLHVASAVSGNSASTTATIGAASTTGITVNPGGPYSVAVNQLLVFNGSKTTDPNFRELAYTWDFGDGSTGTGSQPTHTYTTQGSYTVTLAVSDGGGLNGTATTTVNVSAPAAEVVTAVVGGPYSEATGRNITFDASASTDNLSNPLTYAWTFGDGSTGTGATPSHSYANVGTYTATVTVTSGSASATASVQVNITAALQVVITSPTANQLFGTSTTTVTGTLSVPNLTVTVNNVAATVNGTSFTATGVSLREGVSLITATATDGNGGVGTGSVSVIMDATAPTSSITTPVNGTTVTSSSIAVVGLVNDIVTGTIGSNDVTVTVNGQPAQVSNRSFMLPSLLLAQGSNTITVVATDKVGNSSSTTTTVQFVPPSRTLSLNMLSGNAQTATVMTVLPQPLVVQLTAADGTAIAGRPLTFTVTRSDGMVEILPAIGQSLYVNTDANGKASVLFQLGSRNGVGLNQVAVSTPGATPVTFTESSVLAGATQIHAVYGENQRGLLGQALAEAFQVIVQDAYGNPVAGTAVSYSVLMGDGTLDNQTVTSDSNGKAIATLTLGQQEGVGNYVVNATFTGNTGAPATFAASGYAPGPVASTSVSGVVLDNANTPIPNATVKLLGTNLATVSDINGRFLIPGAPVGIVTLSVDGSTSTRTETFPFLSFVLNDLPGQNNTLNKPVYLPSIDVNNAQTVGGDDPVTLTVTGVPGLSFLIAPHSVTFPDGSTVGKMSVSQVKSDMVPMPPTNGAGPDLVWTMQPAGARFSVPVQVTMPNTQGLAPGSVSEFYQYDHDLEQFVSAGTAHVSADGSVIVSDSGFGVTKAGWAHAPIVPVKTTCVVSCNANNDCSLDSVAPGGCGCIHMPKDGAACGSDTHSSSGIGRDNSCVVNGMCHGFVCVGPHFQAGAGCDDGIFCTDNDECTADGLCQGTPIQPTTVPNSFLPTAAKFSQEFNSGLGLFENFLTKVFKLPISIKVFANPEFTKTIICCEAKQSKNEEQDQAAIEAGASFQPTTELVLPPPYGFTVPFINIKVGFYIKPSIVLSGTVFGNTDSCKGHQYDCFGGKIEGKPTIEAGAVASALGYHAKGFVQTGLIASVQVDCQNITFNFGLQDLTFNIVVGKDDGLDINIGSFTLVSAQDAGRVSYPLF